MVNALKNSTLIEVAKMARVSPSTVSRALNNGSISEKNRNRIDDAIKKLNYRPNAIARSLRGAKSHTVGFVVPDISNPFFTEIIKETGILLKEKGYSILVYSVLEDLELEKSYIKDIMERRLDGLFITSTSAVFADEYEKLNLEVPVIQMDRIISNRMCSVRTDNKSGSLQAISHLLNKGRRRIATIAGPQEYTPGRERYEGYCEALSLYQIEQRSEQVAFGDFSIKSGYQCMKDIISRTPDIDAVFVGNNFMGVGAIQALKEMDKAIPREISVLMFDDLALANMTDPSITVMAQNLSEIGKAITSIFLERSESGLNETREMIISPRLIVRNST
jgi:DNA-binding LacI/PurR family transcriptional regulator